MTMSALSVEEAFGSDEEFAFDPLAISFSTPHEFLIESVDARLARRAVRGASQTLPHPSVWSHTILRATLEVLTGFRPITHINRWVSPEVYASLARRASLALRVAPPSDRQRPVVRNVRVSSVAKGRVDVIATILDGERVRAVAFEMVVRRARWMVTAIQIG